MLPQNNHNRQFQTETITPLNQSNNIVNPLNLSPLVMTSNSYANSPSQGTESNLNTINNLSNQDFVIYSNNSNDSNDSFRQLGNGLNFTGLSARQQPQSVLNSPIFAYTASTTPVVLSLGDDFNFDTTVADADSYQKYINFANLEDQQLTDPINYPDQHTSPHPQAQAEVDQIFIKNILDILSAPSTPASVSIADPLLSPAPTVYSNFEHSPLVGSFTPDLTQVHSQVDTPHTQYINSPLLASLNPYFSPIVHSSPQVPPQTPIGYHSDVASTAPSTAVNTPFTATIPYFDDCLDSPLFESASTPVQTSFDQIGFSTSSIFLPRSISNQKWPSKPSASEPPKSFYPNFPDIAAQPTTFVAMASVKHSSTETEKNANGNNTDAPKNGTAQENATIAPSAITVAPVTESTVSSTSAPGEETSDTSGKGASGTTSADSVANNTSSRPVPILPRPEEISADISESGNAETGESEPARKRRKSESGSIDASDPEDNEHNADGKTYGCPKCGRQFGRKFNMQTHVATHDPNRVKPFSCDFPGCGSRFTRKHDLKRHINGIHKGEKVHECNVCQKPFSRKDAWKRHQGSCGKN